MATDYFVSAVFGLPVPEDLLEAITEAALTAADERADRELDDDFDEDAEPAYEDRVEAVLERDFPDFHKTLRERLHGTEGVTELHWTGEEDDRPGRCETGAGEWLYGVGMFLFGHQQPDLTPEFRKLSEWHTWVGCG